MRGVLVVDDSVAAARVMALELDSDYEVVIVSTGDEAQRVIDARDLFAVVTDLDLGGGSGLAVLEHARTQRPEAVRILVTAAAGGRDPRVHAAVANGVVQRLFGKPWGADAIRRAIVELADRRTASIRVFSAGSSAAADALDTLLGELPPGRQVAVVDVTTPAGREEAIRCGVTKTPTIDIDGARVPFDPEGRIDVVAMRRMLGGG